MRKRLFVLQLFLAYFAMAVPLSAAEQTAPIDFNRDIRPILSNSCFKCHGPDAAERQAGLRLDHLAGATAVLESGARAITPAQADKSELLARVRSTDPALRMPPAGAAQPLTPRETKLLHDWIAQGAGYANHWSYVPPVRPAVPDLSASAAAQEFAHWPVNEIDRFLLARMLAQGLEPSPPADARTLIRRLSLDLTGLPPTWAEVEAFVNDSDPAAYEKLVDRFLAKEAYGEHWGRQWLDLARYADSAGYADDPGRTIWGYRDWVIQAYNANQPFDRFTIEQLAGDLLPNPTIEQQIATAFHRNTLTNSEGGTNDEEFRNVAVVDRVNTTFAVWMGTTIACAQCHTHKYDPITQEEYFQVFAIFNNTEDADRRDESPLLSRWTSEQEQQQMAWKAEIAQLEQKLRIPTPELQAAQQAWEQKFHHDPQWITLKPTAVTLKSGGKAAIDPAGEVQIPEVQKTDVVTVELAVDVTASDRKDNTDQAVIEKGSALAVPSAKSPAFTALRLEALPDSTLPNNGPGHAAGNFVITRVVARVIPPASTRAAGRYVRIEIPGKQQILSLAEVQVFSGEENLALRGTASQSSTAFEGPAQHAIDGNTSGDFNKKSTTHTATEDNPWWEVDLHSVQSIDRIAVWNRTDGNVGSRLKNYRVALLDAQRNTVWEQIVAEPPQPSRELATNGIQNLELTAAHADYSQPNFDAAHVLDGKNPNNAGGWAIGGAVGREHALTLIPAEPIQIEPGARLQLTIEQNSKFENHTLGRFRLSATTAETAAEYAQTPPAIRGLIKLKPQTRTPEQRLQLTDHYLSIAPSLQPQRDRLASLQQQLVAAKPAMTVPIMKELAKPRTTRIQYRGNFLELGPEVTPGLPSSIFRPPPTTEAPLDRLALARWIVDDQNPLTARVLANRYWEAIFGRGIVPTSEEFGSQGELPSHPELLDWLATEWVRLKWDPKAFLKLLVTSAAYRQSSRVTPDLLERDPGNVYLARGPRFRLTAEMIRDQALAVSGLLSPKMYGPPVKPPQPNIGLNAAFGSGIDWQTSPGEDRYRRAIYTTWRRSNPYPSLSTFDAPNREVCTVRRDRTNTPLQALVTLNDPVYIEAAQALARLLNQSGDTPADKIREAYRRCLAREPHQSEFEQLARLYHRAREQLSSDPQNAEKLATVPLGSLPLDADAVELATWTVVANVILNLDEMLMKR